MSHLGCKHGLSWQLTGGPPPRPTVAFVLSEHFKQARVRLQSAKCGEVVRACYWLGQEQAVQAVLAASYYCKTAHWPLMTAHKLVAWLPGRPVSSDLCGLLDAASVAMNDDMCVVGMMVTHSQLQQPAGFRGQPRHPSWFKGTHTAGMPVLHA